LKSYDQPRHFYAYVCISNDQTSNFCVLEFSDFYFNSVPFSLSSFLGAGSDKQTQKPLGAHHQISISRVHQLFVVFKKKWEASPLLLFVAD
jgi:hypothetical protein